MIKKSLGAIVLALCLYTPISGGEKLISKKDFEGWPNKEYHYDGYLIYVEKFLFDFSVKYVRFYEEQDNKVNVLEITYPDGVFEKYWDKNDDLVPDDIEVINGKHIMLISGSVNNDFSYYESEYVTKKREKWYDLIRKYDLRFFLVLNEIKKYKNERKK